MQNSHDACQILWQEVANIGCTKKVAIKYLFARGLLEKSSYMHDCPFCDAYRKKGNTGDVCDNCPWPKNEHVVNAQRCCHPNSPYHGFAQFVHPAENEPRKAVGRKMVKLLKSIDPRLKKEQNEPERNG